MQWSSSSMVKTYAVVSYSILHYYGGSICVACQPALSLKRKLKLNNVLIKTTKKRNYVECWCPHLPSGGNNVKLTQWISNG